MKFREYSRSKELSEMSPKDFIPITKWRMIPELIAYIQAVDYHALYNLKEFYKQIKRKFLHKDLKPKADEVEKWLKLNVDNIHDLILNKEPKVPVDISIKMQELVTDVTNIDTRSFWKRVFG